uniref:Tudor-knot domain-containing protein n=1 Tax=Acrobeloides nanus TaxID=290746 RepID=A0A914D601_9BILA
MSKLDFSEWNKPLKKEDSELFNPEVARRKQQERELQSMHNPDEPVPTSLNGDRKRKAPAKKIPKKAAKKKTIAQVQANNLEEESEEDEKVLNIVEEEDERENVLPTYKYEVGQQVLCFYDGFYYPAKIMKIFDVDGNSVYSIHYEGWNKRYDESIFEKDTPTRFLEFTPANVKKCKTEVEAAKGSKKKKSKN